ncbi:hypothetical protein CU044_0993 [Streptomyces sp. L-9-10]|nr:hypothetical protein CU044_0993 [Streptomyces sp. L-9-10]
MDLTMLGMLPGRAWRQAAYSGLQLLELSRRPGGSRAPGRAL